MSKIFIISDSHFSHNKMTEWSLRPSDFNEKIWKGLEEIPDDGILIHCGDISIGADHMVHERLSTFKFKKWLVRGNHDNHSITWYIRNGWDMVCDEFVLDIFGNKILFTHIPKEPRDEITKNIHGHLHGGLSRGRPSFYDEKYHMEVCPEVIGYVPAKLSQ